jgi:hypothetical protein
MRRIHRKFQQSVIAGLVATSLAVSLFASVRAETANAPSLVISQLKITSSNGQFITLYNASQSTLDMSKYQLEYFNNYDLSKATSSRLISLAGNLPPHSYFMVNDSTQPLCYQLTIDSVSLGLSSTAGFIEVLAFGQSVVGGAATTSVQDYVGWSKTAATGAQTLPSGTNGFLLRQPSDTQLNPIVPTAGAGSWQSVQPDSANACKLVTIVTSGTPTPVLTGLNQLLPAGEPPVTILNVVQDSADTTATPSLPPSDIGLISPGITELLPNPLGSGNDNTDEFVEIYNANASEFDLSGFGLQVGTTNLHSYTFPSGTRLAPKSFTAFFSADTGLSLSNSGGQAKLLDPFGNSLSSSATYGTAKDGQSWALAKGSWQWTTDVTPGAQNVIVVPTAKKKTTKHRATTKTSGSVKGASTSKKAASKASTNSSQLAADASSGSPVHASLLALVVIAALLYGAYEYRADLANHLHQFRRHIAARRAGRRTPTGR